MEEVLQRMLKRSPARGRSREKELEVQVRTSTETGREKWVGCLQKQERQRGTYEG